MDPSATLGASNPVPVATAGAAAAVAAQDTNGAAATGGAAGGAWTNQGLAPGVGMSVGASGALSAPKPAADVPKTRKKGLSVRQLLLFVAVLVTTSASPVDPSTILCPAGGTPGECVVLTIDKVCYVLYIGAAALS